MPPFGWLGMVFWVPGSPNPAAGVGGEQVPAGKTGLGDQEQVPPPLLLGAALRTAHPSVTPKVLQTP